jgi:hypothetical protein
MVDSGNYAFYFFAEINVVFAILHIISADEKPDFLKSEIWVSTVQGVSK